MNAKTQKPKFKIDGDGLIWDRPHRRDLEPDQVEICRQFLAACVPTKTARYGSYGLKHLIESWAETYIANGAAIKAALDLGLVVEPDHPRHWKSPNARIGIHCGRLRVVGHGYCGRLAYMPKFVGGVMPQPPAKAEG